MLHRVVALSALAVSVLVSTPASAYERWIRIHNETSFPICEIYIAHVDRAPDEWGPDLLEYCIDPYEVKTVDPGYLEGYCRADMRFVFSNGYEVINMDYNICNQSTEDFTITE